MIKSEADSNITFLFKKTASEWSWCGHFKLWCSLDLKTCLCFSLFLCAAGTERVEEKSVEERGTVTLNLQTEIQEDEEILWIFGDQNILIAQIREETGEICIYDDGAAGRFRGRLELEKTGSLTITDITPEHTGLYKLQIGTSSRGTLCKRFRVSIPCK